MERLEKFRQLGLSENTLLALKKKGFEEPTEIQEKVIPILLHQDINVIGQAQTGTGKTAAFGLPLIEKLKGGSKKVQAIILTPTRELAIQVAEEINSLKGRKRLHIVPIYGGQSISEQIRKLRKGIDIVVGTPGRVLDHLKRGTLKLDSIKYFILDEADEMLNMGFIDDIEEILSHAPEEKKMLLFSATMPDRILKLVEKYMGKYEIVRIKKQSATTDLTHQIYFEVAERDKFEALCRIIDFEPEFYGLIFTRTKVEADRVANKLVDRGYDAECLHGDISQFQRERIIRKFKKRHINILVATDVAARGLDISDLTHVINYSIPQNPETYIHRIGRTGRAGKEGTAITFVTPGEYRNLIFIKKIAKADIKKEKLPGADKILKNKLAKLKSDIEETIGDNNLEKFIKMAEEMLEISTPEKVVAALLKIAYKDDLDPESYKQISEVSIDTKGTTRLFIARGKEHGFDVHKLIELIQKHIDIESRKIRGIKIFDNFSFVTLPFEDAEVLLHTIKKNTKGKRPIIDKAKEKSRS